MQFKVGSIIDGKYEILGELGSGAMGTVYKAIQKDFNRVVAIKVINECGFSEVAKSRMEREAHSLSNLKHPGIVVVYGFGIVSSMPYLVMECIEGTSLDTAIAQSPMSPARSLLILRQLCEAMAHVHRAGIVHRDLKPQNIILVSDNGIETARIIDLGLARILPELSDRELQKLTSTGFVVGTVHYMSPEHCCGEQVDGRADLYSLGVILFECLAGRLPFDASNPVALMKAQKDWEPPRLAVVYPDADVAGMQVILDKALAKDRIERYQTAEELIADIDMVLSERGDKIQSAGGGKSPPVPSLPLGFFAATAGLVLVATVLVV